MKVLQTSIPDVLIIEPARFEDDRGWFMESFNQQRFYDELTRLGLELPKPFVQDNHSLSRKGVLRGLHFQRAPKAQGKLVRVISGAVYDVAVDIRPDSPGFGQSVGVELSAANQRMLWIPEGFAHGFLALEDNTEFLYKTTDYYSKAHEDCLLWSDKALAIEWPFIESMIINEKDQLAPLLSELKV